MSKHVHGESCNHEPQSLKSNEADQAKERLAKQDKRRKERNIRKALKKDQAQYGNVSTLSIPSRHNRREAKRLVRSIELMRKKITTLNPKLRSRLGRMESSLARHQGSQSANLTALQKRLNIE